MVQTKEYMREYYKKNKEKILQNQKIYDAKHLEERKEYRKSESGKKSKIVSTWKGYGVKCDDFDKLYELYINTKNCDVCKKDFKDSFDRCLDHCHNTCEFRQILCRSCNNNDHWQLIS